MLEYGQQPIKQNHLDEEEVEYKQTNLREKNKDNPWIFYPDDKIKKVWEFLVALLVLYTAIMMPYVLAFVDNQSWNQVQDTVDIFFMVDIVINFNSAYFNEHRVLVVNRYQIFKNYLSGWFIIDFISVFPFQRLQSMDDHSKDQSIIKFARITKMFQLQRLFKLTRLVKLFKIVNVFQEISLYFQNNLGVSQSLERLFASSLVLILFCHIYSCLWYIMQKIIESDKIWYKVHQIEEGSTNFSIYISCYYFILQTFVTTGYGDLSPQNTSEYIIIIILMILGCFVYSFIIGNLIDLLQVYNNRFKEKQNKLNIIAKMQIQYNIPKSKILVAKYYINNIEDLNYGPEQLIESLNQEERLELIYRMQKQKLEGISYFANKSKQFICLTSYHAAEIRLKKYDTLYFQDDKAQELYFLKEGQIGYCICNNNDMVFLQIEKGEMFGDLEYFYYSEKRRYRAIATQNCILYSINKSKLSNVLIESFKSHYTQLQIQSYLKKKQIKLIWKKAFDYKFYEHEQNENVDIDIQYKLFCQVEQDLFQQYYKTNNTFETQDINDQDINLQLYFNNKYEYQSINNIEKGSKDQSYYISKIQQINLEIERYQQQSNQQSDKIVALKNQIKQVEIIFNNLYKDCIQQKFGINNLNLDISQFDQTYDNIKDELDRTNTMSMKPSNRMECQTRKEENKTENIKASDQSSNMQKRLQGAMRQMQNISHIKSIFRENKKLFNNLSIRYQRRNSVCSSNVRKNEQHQLHNAIQNIQKGIEAVNETKSEYSIYALQTMKTIDIDEHGNEINNDDDHKIVEKSNQFTLQQKLLRKKTTLISKYEDQKLKIQKLIEQNKLQQEQEQNQTTESNKEMSYMKLVGDHQKSSEQQKNSFELGQNQCLQIDDQFDQTNMETQNVQETDYDRKLRLKISLLCNNLEQNNE